MKISPLVRYRVLAYYEYLVNKFLLLLCKAQINKKLQGNTTFISFLLEVRGKEVSNDAIQFESARKI